MGNVAFLLIPVGFALLGLLAIGVKSLLDRPKPYDAMTDFQRSLDALAGRAPRDRTRRRR